MEFTKFQVLDCRLKAQSAALGITRRSGEPAGVIGRLTRTDGAESG
ncbi:MAG: hypothetical protein K1Y36_21630 [Blastocatellia bacterium]|nr:hypothetical protein [Blastocatellia bacterium]